MNMTKILLTSVRLTAIATLLTVVLTACSTQSRVARAERQAAMAAYVSNALEQRDFTISIDRMKPLHGMPKQVSYGYELTVKGNTVNSYLPYVGEVYRVPYGGGVGLNFTGEIQDYAVEYPSSDLTRITFTVTNDEDTYTYRVDIYSNGKAIVDVYAYHRTAISFDGEVKVPQDK